MYKIRKAYILESLGLILFFIWAKRFSTIFLVFFVLPYEKRNKLWYIVGMNLEKSCIELSFKQYASKMWIMYTKNIIKKSSRVNNKFA